MSWISFEEYLHSTYEHWGPLAVVVGAGIHSLPPFESGLQSESRKLLSTWQGLIGSMGATAVSGHSAAVQWELLALKGPDDRQARMRNDALLKRASAMLSDAEDHLWGPTASGPIGGDAPHLVTLVQSSRVADLVVLNLDLTIELLLGDRSRQPTPTGNRSPANRLLERHRMFERNGAPVRVWHPHGDRRVTNAGVLGLVQYANTLAPLRQAFQTFKQAERADGYDAYRQRLAVSPGNWFELFMSRPLLFVGTSLSHAEWDLWYALVMRWRNFAKDANRRFLPPAWILTTPGTHLDIPAGEDRIQRLEGADWSQAWTFLSTALA